MRANAEPARAALSVPLWLLVLVTLSGTMAMHIFVPALPVAGQGLGASPSSMQQTITLYVLGLAAGQLIYGPVSDALGRRPALLIGLVIYFCASLLALVAPTLEWLVAARLMQALGGAAGITLGRAIVRDVADPARVTKDLALLNLLTLVGPGLSPIIGAYLADHFGWRSIYVFLLLMGLAMVVCSFRLLPETNLNKRPLRIRVIGSDYLGLLSNARFAAYALGGACATTALYPYLASVSYIVHSHMGLPVRDIGWFAASTIVGASFGTLTARRVASRWTNERLLFLGAGLSLTMALTLLAVHLLGALSPAALLAITITMTFGAGLASPAALASALNSAPLLAGSAAGVYGFGQMAMGALGTFVVGYGDDPVLACAITQICLTALAYASFSFASSRAGQGMRDVSDAKNAGHKR